MGKKTSKWYWLPVVLAVSGLFIWYMNFSFDHYRGFKELFSAAGSGVYGQVEANSAESIAMRSELTARISMLIFSVITVLQFIALGIGYIAVASIRDSSEPASLKLKRLENSDVFFDIPLYFGLFGTVSAFLVMNFSPQNSRLIAYSSTLIGIIFSLVLRLAMQYPLKQRLLGENAGELEK